MAQTLAELVLKIRSDDTARVKKDLADIESALKRIETQAARSMRGFNAQQSRLLRGQVGQTSGSSGNVMAGTASALREVTKELEKMHKPLNAAIDGFTQIGQILTNKTVAQALYSGRSGRAAVQPPIGMSGVFKSVIHSRRKDLFPINPFHPMSGELLEDGTMSPGGGRLGIKGALANLRYRRDMRFDPSYPGGQETRAKTYNALVGFQEGSGNLTTRPLAGAFGLAQNAAMGLAGALASATAALVNYAKEASNASVERESLRARLGGLDRKGSSVDQILGLSREVAGPSKFTTKQMEQMSAQVLSYGLNVERILPLIGKLGNAFGAGPEQLSMYGNAFGQLAGGQMPDIQVLNQMGITKAMLKQRGVQFKGTELISSTEKVMVEMERIINDKYKKVTQLMASTTESTRANIQDSLDQIQISFGDAINRGLAPFEAGLSTVLKDIEGSRFAEAVAKDLVAPLTVFTGTVNNLTDALKQLIAYTAAFASAVPRQLAKAVDEWNNVSTQQNAIGGLQRVGSRSMTILRFLGGLFDPTGSGLGATTNIPDTAQKYLDQMNKKGASGVPSNTKRLTDPFGGILPFGGGDDAGKKEKSKRTLEKIENNTRKSAELLDLRRQTIGGGEIASLGITGAEIAGIGLKNRSEISLRSPIRPDTQVIRGIKDLVYGNMNFALQGSPINRVRF